ncbi:unnamed protein product [Rotaria sp. Silwood1]|nr:unnamed protein product [Rotaria sp. Silwood1]CAF4953716.1 unnamed protein product [Rotaria sp. Silwood1]
MSLSSACQPTVTGTSFRWEPAGITVAGTTGVAGVSQDLLNLPYTLAFDSTNSLYICDHFNSRIQKWVLGASNGTTVAGQPNGALGSSAAHLYRPAGIALDSNGNVLVGDTYNHRVQMWQQGASSGTTIAGATGSFGLPNDRLYNPFGIARDPRTGALYIADRENHRVMSYLPGSSSGTVVAGGNGPGVKNTQLYLPIAVRFDMSTESLVILNYGANNIVRWKLGESNGTHVAGNIHGGSGVTSMHLNGPVDMVLDHWGNIYVADTNNHRIQFFKAGETNGTTLAGITGAIGNVPTQLNSPYGLALDKDLNLYVSDAFNHRVLKFLRY